LSTLGWIGVWLLVAGALAIVIEGVLAVVWGVGMARRTRALSERLETERGLIEADLERLRAAMEETRRLWKPYRRVLRLLRHPLMIALLESFARRRAAAR
jgi:hypothetical protein